MNCEALYSEVLHSGALHSSLLPDSPSMFSVWTFLFSVKLICLAVVNIAVNGARYIPYL